MADKDDVDPAEESGADAVDPSSDDSETELVSVGAAAERRDGVAARAVGSGGRVKKDKATQRQKQVAERPHRTGPVQFVRESVSELQKVVYPTGQQLVNYFIVVLIFVLFIIAIVSVLDLAFGKAILAVFS